MVIEQRDTLLTSDFATCLYLLQNYPPVDVTKIIERGISISESYENKLGERGDLKDVVLDGLHRLRGRTAGIASAFHSLRASIKASIR
jgi:hypothetical protein